MNGRGKRSLGMLLASAVVGTEQGAAAFVRSAADVLAPAELRLVRLWREEPWRYSIFTVEQELGEELLEVSELELTPSGTVEPEGDPILLFSPGIGRSFREGRTLFYSLLWWNGRCYQTYGPIAGFVSFEPQDFGFFTREITASRGGDVAAAVRDSGEPIESVDCTEEIGRIRLGQGSPMYDPVVYFARGGWEGGRAARSGAASKRSRVHVVAMNEPAYARARTALAKAAPLPEVPQRRFTLAMHLAASRILGGRSEADRLEAAWSKLDERTGDKPAATGPEAERGSAEHAAAPSADGEALPTLDQANAIMQRLADSHNEGRIEDDETVARALGANPAIVASLRTQLEPMFGRLHDASPAADCFGLSPNAFHRLMHRRVPSVAGVSSLRALDEYRSDPAASAPLAEATLVCCAQWLLRRIAERGGIRSTQAGNLPVAFVDEAYSSGRFPRMGEWLDSTEAARLEAPFHPHKEEDWDFLRELRRTLEQLGLLSHEPRGFRVSERGAALADDPARLHRTLLEGLLSDAEWRSLPNLPTIAPLQDGAPFLLYALQRLFGSGASASWVPLSRLIEVFVAAVPWLAPKGGSDRSSTLLELIVEWRFVRFFAAGLGLIDTRPVARKPFAVGSALELRTTPLFGLLFEHGSPSGTRTRIRVLKAR